MNQVKKNFILFIISLSLFFTSNLFASIWMPLILKNIATPSQLKADPWHLTADGEWVTTVYVTDTKLSVKFKTSAGAITPLARWVFNTKAITLTLQQPENVKILATIAGIKPLSLYIYSPTKCFSGLQMTASSMGPYLVNIGWSLLNTADNIRQYRLYRQTNNGSLQLIATLANNVTHYHDITVLPNQYYRYQLFAVTAQNTAYTAEQLVNTPSPLKSFPSSIMQGKGITVYFSPDPDSYCCYQKLSPYSIMRDLKAMGIKYVLLRTVYGSYSHINSPEVANWLNTFLDAAHAQHIAVLSWTIPQDENSEAIYENVHIASYVTPNGNTFAGTALDLETGNSYITDLSTAKQQIADYAKWMRTAVGQQYLLTMVIEPPLSKKSHIAQYYPYQQLGQYGNVIQPMVFWHHYLQSKHHKYTRQEISKEITDTIKFTRNHVGKKTTINIIGQIIDLGKTGTPSADEITTALRAAKTQGVIGVTFFNWNDKLVIGSAQAKALRGFSW